MTSKTTADISRPILVEASAWFVDFRIGDIDATARDRFEHWLRRSPEHIQAYLEMAGVWSELPVLGETRELDVDQLIAAARESADVIPLNEDARRKAVRGPPLRRPLLAACITVTLLGAGFLGWWALHRDPIYATEIGEQRSIVLSDGSTVDLSARSRLRIRFSKAERDIDLLEGQALFQVAQDTQRPFVVRSDGTTVRVVGTQFDVNQQASGTVVTVLEGRVVVVPDKRATALVDPASIQADLPQVSLTYLSAGEQVIESATSAGQPKRTDVAAATAWTHRKLVFELSRLADVVDQFNRYNRRQLIIASAELRDFRISGVYSSTDPTSLVRFLKAQPGFEVTETESQIRVSQHSAP